MDDDDDNDSDDDDYDDGTGARLLSILATATIMPSAPVNVPSLAPDMESLLNLHNAMKDNDNDSSSSSEGDSMPGLVERDHNNDNDDVVEDTSPERWNPQNQPNDDDGDDNDVLADIHVQANHVAAAADQDGTDDDVDIHVQADRVDTLMEAVNDMIFPTIDNSTNVLTPEAIHSSPTPTRPEPSHVVLTSAKGVVDPTTYYS